MKEIVCVHRWGCWVKLGYEGEESAFRECRNCHEHQFSGQPEPRVVIGRIEES